MHSGYRVGGQAGILAAQISGSALLHHLAVVAAQAAVHELVEPGAVLDGLQTERLGRLFQVGNFSEDPSLDRFRVIAATICSWVRVGHGGGASSAIIFIFSGSLGFILD